MKPTRAQVLPADDDLMARRERGRNAQKAFRQRQITTINQLRDSNYAMQSAIVSLTSAASQLGNAELDDAIRKARQAAGLEDPEAADVYPGDDGEPNEPLLSQPAQKLPPENSSMVAKAWPPPFTPNEPSSSSPSDHYVASMRSETDGERAAEHQDGTATAEPVGYQIGRMSPRLGYGLWLERPVFRMSNPPADIIPFLEADTTLSTVLFWSCLFRGFKILQAALGGDTEAAVMAHRAFGEIPPMKPDRKTLDGIHARLTFRKLGYLASDHPGYDPDGDVRMQDMMARTCAAHGTPLETFLRPDGVEHLLRSRFGKHYQVIELGLRGLGSWEELSWVRGLVDMMVRNSVCLGDGPRLRVDWIVKLIKPWLEYWDKPQPQE